MRFGYGALATEELSIAATEALATRTIRDAATYLDDAVHYRFPYYSQSDSAVSQHRFRSSAAWSRTLLFSALCYWLMSFYEDTRRAEDTAPLQYLADLLFVSVFVVDLYMRYQVYGVTYGWTVMTFATTICGISALFSLLTGQYVFETSLLRPVFLVDVTDSNRNSLRNTLKTLPHVLPVLCLQLMIVTIFGCVTVALYGDFDNADYGHLQEAFISLFKLSTTVNNPDVWLALYADNSWNAILFIVFSAITVFFLHNLVAVTVFGRFTREMHDTVQQRKQWRQASLVKAFQVLDLHKTGRVPAEGVFAVLQYLRPHYPPAKIQLLYEKIDPRHHGSVEMADFVKIIDALNMRVMTSAPTLTSKIASLFNLQLHWRNAPLPLFAVIVCALNTIVVIRYCAIGDAAFTMTSFWIWMTFLTLMSFVQFIATIAHSGTRGFYRDAWNAVTSLGLFVSIAGLALIMISELAWPSAVTWTPSKRAATGLVVIGRALDMVTAMRWFAEYRAVFQTIFNVASSVASHCVMIITFLHVYAFVGILLFKGDVQSETYTLPYPYYYMCNMNSYGRAMVLLFDLLIVNNWNFLAAGFVEARGDWVYVYFMSFNMLLAGVVLATVTAFFINAFMARYTQLSRVQAHPAILTDEPHDVPVEFTSSANLEMMTRKSSATSLEEGEKGGYQVHRRHLDEDDLFRQMEKGNVAEYATILNCVCQVLKSHIRVSVGRQVVFQSDSFAEVAARYGGENHILVEVQHEMASQIAEGRDPVKGAHIFPAVPEEGGDAGVARTSLEVRFMLCGSDDASSFVIIARETGRAQI